MRTERGMVLLAAVSLLTVAISGPAWGQVNTAEMSGTILDPQGAGVPGAQVTAKNRATSATRTTVSDDTGHYRIVGLRPGAYTVAAEAAGFAQVVDTGVVLTIGQLAEVNVQLQLGKETETVTIAEGAELIETRRTAVTETVDSHQIDNLPINGRNYINFTLLDSQAQRDSAPSIGAAPTSGINFSGQRARSNQVSVDGADAVDNSVNGIRSTVSQEAVQEFQLIISNYMPEFGRATGGVINIVTKSGSNQLHGNLFGFFRHKDLQARNPFSVEIDPATGLTHPIKQAYTRVQAGATLGGPIKKDRTFYFLSYETTRRQETGFTNIGSNNFGLVQTQTPFFPAPLWLTPQQAAFVSNPTVLSAPGGLQTAAEVALLAGSASNVAIHGTDYGAIATAFGVLTPPGSRFPLPVDCNPLASPPIFCAPSNLVNLPRSFVPLQSLVGNYPISEGTSLWSARLDHRWNDQNNSFLRVSVSPSLVTGIQVNAQNQNFGQNAGSRTSLQQFRDFSIVAQHQTSLSSSLLNEARFQFARRGLHYGFSQLPGGDQVAVNITGFAFFGREPFSTEDRIERRFQWTDNVSWVKGQHNVKFGADVNLVQLRSDKAQIFELNFGGVYNFGSLTASNLGLPNSFAGVPLPGVTAVQAYGLGIPAVFFQGIGNSNRPFDNKAFGFFLQDSWKIHPRLTLNYGVRYDVELTPIFSPATSYNAALEPALGVMEGIPRDKNNWSPRLAIAWDPTGSGNTVIRAGYGIFFDHPLLGIAFNASTAEGALSTQLIAPPGLPTRASVLTDPTGALNASSIFQGVLNAIPSMGYLPDQQRFDPKLPNSLFMNQNYMTAGFPLPFLPLTLPIARNFVYAYAQQGDFSIERKLGRDYKLNATYNYTHGLHLNRPRVINTPDPRLLTLNYRNALAAGLAFSDPRTVAAPLANVAPTASTCGVAAVAPGALGALFGCPDPLAALNGKYIGTAAFFNFFRSTGPNPSFAGLVPGGYDTQVGLAQLAGFPMGILGVQVPWGSIDQQESSGRSIYHGLTVTVSKRFGQHFEFLSGWTWSHAIDDSTDLQTLLEPQDDRMPGLERGNSTFDQRHRWVTSAVFQSPYSRSSDGWYRKFLADFTVAPIVEVGSGRPYTVLTGTDLNLDFSSNTDRPSLAPSGGVTSPFIPGAAFTLPTVCDEAVALGTTSISPPFGCTGSLGRNTFVRPGFASVDLRVSRKFFFSERLNLEFIADAFNLFNRFNVADVNPLCDPLDPSTCRAGEPTASLDPRQFQFALKINW
ncbi:MAG: TonB-dependent receptor [Acidobacteriia bacterium]|nr:TonB-dependent receptor [Terriglobia bacterium]